MVNYKCTSLYDPYDQNTIIWNDKDLNINWNIKKPILSTKDKQGVFFKRYFLMNVLVIGSKGQLASELKKSLKSKNSNSYF